MSVARLRRVVCAVIGAALLASGLGLGACSSGGSYEVTAFFPSAISLYTHSQVRVLGLPAGHV